MLIKTSNIQMIAELDHAIFANKSYPYDSYKQMLNNSSFFLISTNEQNIGFIVFNRADLDLELIKIGILSTYQNKGFATQALKEAIDLLEYENIFLEVSALNSFAIQLYQNLGFSIINTRKNYYTDNSDAIIMKLVKSQS